jgi:lipoyl(octanoyl) transferase
MVRQCEAYWLGRVEYPEGLQLQQAFLEARRQGSIPDTLFLLEHPHVITLGRGANRSNLVASPKLLKTLGIQVHETGRGGDITYHGPQQLVGYPLLHLAPERCDVHRYVRDLEEVMIRTTADFGIKAARVAGLTGIWVGNEKLAAIGVRISRWFTMHGFAYNVNTDLDYFQLIVPCGISDPTRGVTSLAKLLGEPLPMAKVVTSLQGHFAAVFDREMVIKPIAHQSVQVIVFDDHGEVPLYLLLRRTVERGDFWQPVTGGIKQHRQETPLAAAARETQEETGLTGDLINLDYTHSFYLEPHLMKQPATTPQINCEYSFAMQANTRKVVIDPQEHVAAEWVDYSEAMKRLVWQGNKTALTRVHQLHTNLAGPRAKNSMLMINQKL